MWFAIQWITLWQISLNRLEKRCENIQIDAVLCSQTENIHNFINSRKKMRKRKKENHNNNIVSECAQRTWLIGFMPSATNCSVNRVITSHFTYFFSFKAVSLSIPFQKRPVSISNYSRWSFISSSDRFFGAVKFRHKIWHKKPFWFVFLCSSAGQIWLARYKSSRFQRIVPSCSLTD